MLLLIIALIIFVGGVSFAAVSRKAYIGVCAFILSCIVVFISTISIIPAGHTGVVSTFGKISDNVLQEGWNSKAPWQTVTVMDNRVVKLEVATQAFSSDLQTVDVNVAVNYRVDKSMSYNIIKNVGKSYEGVLVTPAVNEVLKSIVAQYTAEQSITNRPLISADLLEGLNARLNVNGIYVEEINIIDFDFSPTYIAAIEAKQVAEQEMLKAKIEQEQKTMETQAAADRAIIDAEAALEVAKIEADAAEYAGAKEAAKNTVIAESLTPELVQYYYVLQWNGVMPTVMSGGETMTLIDMAPEIPTVE